MLGPSHIIKRLGMTFVICRDSEAIDSSIRFVAE